MNSTHIDALSAIRPYVPIGALHCRFTIIGCGALGSHIARLLARLGARSFTLYDPDQVEARNLGLQDFGAADIGQPKVEALQRRLQSDFSFHQLEIEAMTAPYRGQGLTDIIIAVPDNIDARRAVWQEARVSDHAMLLIDGRTHRSSAHIYTIRPAHPGDAAYYADQFMDTIPAAACSDPLLPPIVA